MNTKKNTLKMQKNGNKIQLMIRMAFEAMAMNITLTTKYFTVSRSKFRISYLVFVMLETMRLCQRFDKINLFLGFYFVAVIL